jgi:hypothetical protein
MKFSIYNCFTLEVIREKRGWSAFRLGQGIKSPEENLVFPPDLKEDGLIRFLDDIYHELASPGACIKRLG